MLIKPTPSNLKYTKNRCDENSHVWEDQPQYVDKATPSNLKYTKNRSDENSHVWEDQPQYVDKAYTI